MSKANDWVKEVTPPGIRFHALDWCGTATVRTDGKLQLTFDRIIDWWRFTDPPALSPVEACRLARWILETFE